MPDKSSFDWFLKIGFRKDRDRLRRWWEELKGDPKPAPEDPVPDPVRPRGLIFYDPGHTAQTRTNRSPAFDDGSYLFEYEAVRRIGSAAVDLWRSSGYKVVDTSPPVAGPENFQHRKRVENEGYRKAESVGLPVWFFSLHTNAIGPFPPVWRPDARGIEVFYYPGNERSRAAAKIIAQHLHDVTGFRLRWEDGTKEAKFFVLRETMSPANLIEFGFHTNPTEAEFLRSEAAAPILSAALVTATDEIFDRILNPLSPEYIPEQTANA